MPFEAYLRDSRRHYLSGEGGGMLIAHYLHAREAACGSGWRYMDPFCYHSSCCNGAHQHPSLQPRPLQRWFKQRGWRRLPDVLREFLGAGLVPRPLKCMKCSVWLLLHIIGHYYILYCIITFTIITYYYVFYFLLLIHHYYALLH